MSNYEANPVGFLYERYQSSGVSPLYEVTMTRGQAHAPIFEAVLKEPGGLEVKAQGSSKKIAKNLAAKMMLDMLDGKEKDHGLTDQVGVLSIQQMFAYWYCRYFIILTMKIYSAP